MFDEMKRKMEEILRLVGEELKLIRAGRAKPEMIEQVQVEAYEGQKMPLIELATISAPDPHMLSVQAWDASVVNRIEKALQKSDLNLNPAVDGNMIRINVPPLTQERREDLVRLVKQKIESGKNMLRDARQKTKKELDDREGEPGVSEDDIAGWLDEMQELFDGYMDRLEKMGEAKEKDLMEI